MIQIDYPVLAFLWSIATIAVYAVLVLIAARRAALKRQAVIASHARFVELPAHVFGLVIGVFTLVSALNLANPEYGEVVVLTVAAIRGALLFGGAYLLGYFWFTRETWL